MIEIAVTVIAGIFSLGGVYIGVVAKQVKTEITTNHGKSASQYLEMIEDVRTDQRALLTLLAEHTATDSQEFGDINVKLDSLTSLVDGCEQGA